MATSRIDTPSPSGSGRNSEEMLFIGQRCSHDACNLVDFLPLKCQYCNQPFCSSHFTLSTHPCPSRPPEHTLNRTTPLCPLCSSPISTLPGEDPNGPMERHISRDCRGLEGKKEEWRMKRERGEVCWRRGCGKMLFAKIRCNECKHDFCPSHRYPNQHTCPSLTSSSSTPLTAPQPTRAQQQLDSKLLGIKSSNPLLARLRAKQSAPSGSASVSTSTSSSSSSSSASASTTTKPTSTSKPPSSNSLANLPFGARRDAALAAMKRLGQKPDEGKGSSSSSLGGAAVVSGNGGGGGGGEMDMAALKAKFKIGSSVTDKQAKAELASIFKSLEIRHQKGLLNERDKVRYAEMCAERERARRLGVGSGKGEDCAIM